MFKIFFFANYLIMKKVFAVLIGCYSHKDKFTLQDYFAGTYYCYSQTANNNASVDLGFCFLNYEESSNPIGESMVIENYEPISAIEKLNANILKTEHLDNGATVIYAYSNKIGTSVDLNDKKVNLQLACYEDYCIIGWPLILGSF